MASYKFSFAAKRDIAAIAQYTTKEWGTEQALRYINELEATAELLTNNPDAATERKDLRERIRSFPCKSHTLYFVVSPTHSNLCARII